MPKAKTIEFTPEFEKILSEGKEPRGDILGRQPLKSIIENSNVTKKTEFLKVLNKVPDLGKLSLNDYMGSDTTKKSMAILTKALATDKISNSEFKTFIGPMKNLLDQVGITAQGTANPFRAQLRRVVSPSELKKLDEIESGSNRLIPTGFSQKTYEAIKNVGASLKQIDSNVHLQYVLHLLGGYRPSDFKNLKLENINFNTGLVSGLDFKTDDGTEIKLAYFPRPQLDAIKSYLKNKGIKIDENTGTVTSKALLFKNWKSNSEKINKELDKTGITNQYYQEKTKGIITKNFSVYDFRRLKETHLTNKNILPDNPIRKTLTWRAPSGVVEKYTAGRDIGGQLEDANAKSNASLVLLGKQSGGGLSLAQYLGEIGVDSEDIGGYTKRLRILQSDLLNLPPDKLEYAEKNLGPLVNTLPNEQMSLSMVATQVDPNAVKNFQQLAATNLKVEQLTAESKVDDLTIEKAKKLPEVQKAQQDIEKGKEEKKIADKQERINKGNNFLSGMMRDGLTKDKKVVDKTGKIIADNSDKLTGALAFLGAYTMAKEVKADFLKYKEQGSSDIMATVGAGAEAVRDVVVGSGKRVATMLPEMFVRPAQVQEVDGVPPGDFSPEEKALQTIQRDTGIQTDQTPEVEPLNIVEQDTNIGNKMSTFGRTPDVSPGFVTPPSRQDLNVETERQQNFLGVT